jgi:hypothetical protein
MLASSSVDHTSLGCIHPDAPGLALFSSLTTISATLFSRFRIPADDVTVNWSSVHAVCLVHVQSATKTSGPLDWDPSPRPLTREHALHQQLNGLLAVVGQVTIIKFCEQIMSITSIIISACTLWLELPFQFFHCFFSNILFLLRSRAEALARRLEETWGREQPNTRLPDDVSSRTTPQEKVLWEPDPKPLMANHPPRVTDNEILGANETHPPGN